MLMYILIFIGLFAFVASKRQSKPIKKSDSKVCVELQPLLTLQACLHSDDFDSKDYNRALQVDIDSYNNYLKENNIPTPNDVEIHFCGSGVFAVYTWSDYNGTNGSDDGNNGRNRKSRRIGRTERKRKSEQCAE